MPQREVIKISDVRQNVVKLDFGPEGVEREGSYGVQYQYTLNDDSAVMWVKPAIRDAIIASGAAAGDSVRIQRHGKGYVATVISDAHEPAPAPPPPAPAPAAPKPNGKPATNGNGSLGYEHRLFGCFQVSINVLRLATEYAKSVNWPLTFNEEDIRATAISLFINLERNIGGAK